MVLVAAAVALVAALVFVGTEKAEDLSARARLVEAALPPLPPRYDWTLIECVDDGPPMIETTVPAAIGRQLIDELDAGWRRVRAPDPRQVWLERDLGDWTPVLRLFPGEMGSTLAVNLNSSPQSGC